MSQKRSDSDDTFEIVPTTAHNPPPHPPLRGKTIIRMHTTRLPSSILSHLPFPKRDFFFTSTQFLIFFPIENNKIKTQQTKTITARKILKIKTNRARSYIAEKKGQRWKKACLIDVSMKVSTHSHTYGVGKIHINQEIRTDSPGRRGGPRGGVSIIIINTGVTVIKSR